MKILNKNNFDINEFKNGNIVVNCDTFEKALDFTTICFNNNIKFLGLDKNIMYPNGENTCYRYCCDETLSGLIEYIGYSSISCYEENEIFQIFKWEIIKGE